MPIQFDDQITQPAGAIPAGPIAGALTGALGAYNRTFPTQLERSEINLRNAQTQGQQQENAAPTNMKAVFDSAFAPQVTSNPDGTTSIESPGDTVRRVLPSLIGATPAAHMQSLGPLALLLASNLKGTPGEVAAAPAGQLSTEDTAMLGAGQPIAATPGGMKLDRSLGTPEMRDRNFKINQIMQTQGATQKQAAAIVDGVIEGGLDPVTRQPYVINKLDMMNRTTPGASSPTTSAAPTGGAPDPNADPNDFVAQLDAAKNGPGVQGGTVPITGGSQPSAAPEYPTASPSDLNIDFNKAYGGASAVGKLGSMYDAVMGNDTKGGAASEIAKGNAFKSGYLAIMGQHPGFRNNATAQGLNINQLPDTGPVTDIEDIGKQAVVKPSDAATAYTQAMNNVIQMRQSDAALVSDTTKPPEERISAQNRMRDEDNFIKMHGGPELQTSYAAAAGIPAPAVPQTNQTALKTATAPVTASTPTRAQATAMKPGAKFTDAKGVSWQKQADGSFVKVQ